MEYMRLAVQIGTMIAPFVYGAYAWWKSEPSRPAPQPETQPQRQYISRSRSRRTQRREHRTQNNSRVEEIISESDAGSVSGTDSEADTDDEGIESVSDIEELECFARGMEGSHVPSVRA
jgi:hypothetical protein